MNDAAPRSIGEAYDVWVAAVNNTYRELVEAAAALVPSLVGAAVLLLVGWLLAFLLRNLILRLGTGLDRLAEGLRLRADTEVARLQWPVSRIVAVTAYWLVILFFIAAAAQVLGLSVIADLFGAFIAYVPTVIVAAAALAVIVALSGTAAAWVERTARSAGIASAPAMATLVRLGLIAMASIIALGHVGVDTTLLTAVFSVIVAAFLIGAGLAFGIGAAGAVRNVISAHQLRVAYRVGQRVRVAGEEGEILELTPTAVVLETDAGRTLIPARLFDEGASVLLDEGSDGS